MKIAVITDYNNRTWIGKQNFQLYSSLKSIWIDVEIINLVSKQWFKNTPNYWINITSELFLFGSFFKFKRELKKIFFSKQYTHIIYWHQWLSYLYWLCNCFDLFTLYPEYTPAYDPRFILYNLYFLRNIKKYKNIVFDSEFSRQDYWRFFTLEWKNTSVIHIWFNPWNTNKLSKINLNINLNWKKIILHVWSEDKRKNIETFYKIAEKYVSDKNILFIRVWNIKQANLDKINSGGYSNVVYLNNLSEEELNWLYSVSDLFLFTSYHEWYWMPLVEAYSHSLPIVSSKVSDMALIFKWDPNVHFVEDASDVNEYTTKINDILDNPKWFIKQKIFPILDSAWEAKEYLKFIEIC